MKFLFFLFYVFLLGSCEPYSEAYLCNKSQSTIEIIIRIDEKYINGSWNGNQSARFLKQFKEHDKNLMEIKIDTVTLAGHYRIQEGNCVILYDGIKKSPYFSFNYLAILTKNDTVEFNSREKIEAAFKQVKGTRFELTV